MPSTAAAGPASLTQVWVAPHNGRQVALVFDKGKVDILMQPTTYKSALRYIRAFVAQKNLNRATDAIGQVNGRPALVVWPDTDAYNHSNPAVVGFDRNGIFIQCPEPGSAAAILGQLGDLPRRAGYDPQVLASERVQAAIVIYANGDLERFGQAVELAATDWRDLLIAAGLADDDWPQVLDRDLGPTEEPSLSIEEVRDINGETVAAFGRLVRQLSPRAPQLDAAALALVTGRDGVTVLAVKANGTIVGTLTLVTFPSLTGLRAWIEDMVVDDSARRRGAGTALMNYAIELAQQAGARAIDLTSRPSREAANRLYQQLGFHERDSRVYRLG